MLPLQILKSLHTLFDKYFDHMLVKFDQNSMAKTTQNFELFLQKKKKTTTTTTTTTTKTKQNKKQTNKQTKNG